MTTRTTITLINKIFVYINQNCFIFLDAQNIANVAIDGDDNTYNNLIDESEKIDYIKITLAKISIAFKLTRINSRFDINRVKVIREDTHITKINENLTRVNVIL